MATTTVTKMSGWDRRTVPGQPRPGRDGPVLRWSRVMREMLESDLADREQELADLGAELTALRAQMERPCQAFIVSATELVADVADARIEEDLFGSLELRASLSRWRMWRLKRRYRRFRRRELPQLLHEPSVWSHVQDQPEIDYELAFPAALIGQCTSDWLEARLGLAGPRARGRYRSRYSSSATIGQNIAGNIIVSGLEGAWNLAADVRRARRRARRDDRRTVLEPEWTAEMRTSAREYMALHTELVGLARVHEERRAARDRAYRAVQDLNEREAADRDAAEAHRARQAAEGERRAEADGSRRRWRG